MKNETNRPLRQAAIATGESSLIDHWRNLLRRRFGDVNTDSGAATLMIAHDYVHLIDHDNRIVACSASSAARLLSHSTDRSMLVRLDAQATAAVGWYAKRNEQRSEDVVNGIITGEIGHLRQQSRGGFHDDTAEHLREYVQNAARRRKCESQEAAHAQ